MSKPFKISGMVDSIAVSQPNPDYAKLTLLVPVHEINDLGIRLNEWLTVERKATEG